MKATRGTVRRFKDGSHAKMMGRWGRLRVSLNPKPFPKGGPKNAEPSSASLGRACGFLGRFGFSM